MRQKEKKARKKKANNSAQTGRETGQIDKSDASQRFVEDLVTRGEAALPDESGHLPPGATHEIVEESETGPPKVKRRRFSAF